jgi:hypothetical protein
MARKLAIHLLWMMRRRWDYEQVKRFGPHAGQPETRRGVDEGTLSTMACFLDAARQPEAHQRAVPERRR